jgi:dTDP-4-dehydrorhamnose reductase
MSYRILLIGSNGQLGWELRRTLAPLGEVVCMDRSSLDLTDTGNIQKAVRTTAPRLVVNAAAYTAVDLAEREPDLADQINHRAPVVMAEECRRLGAGLIHYSTDYVFSGEGATGWKEDDATAPLNRYGVTKLQGEQGILASGCTAVILRTSWVYATRGKNFLRTMVRLAREREELRIVDDQTGAPTWSRMLAEATAVLVARAIRPDGDVTELQKRRGVYHCTAAGQTSWYGFAEAIFSMLPDTQRRCQRLFPISAQDFPTPARRPQLSVLDNSRLAEAFGIRLPDWREQLALALNGVSADELARATEPAALRATATH